MILALAKKILGWDSPYSWMKYIRMAALAVALFLVTVFLVNSDMGMFGGLVALIIAIPVFAALLAGTMLIGTIVGGLQSGKKQAHSLRESAASGSDELLSLDQLRIKVQVLGILKWLAAAVAAVAYVGDIYPVAGIAIFVALWILTAVLKSRYNASFKDQIVRKELASFLGNVEFVPDRTLDEGIVKESQIFSRYDVISGNDYLAADYKDKHFTQSDLHLQKEHRRTYINSNGNTRAETSYTTVFRGRLMIFDYDAISNQPVHVFDKRMRRAASGAIETELDAFNKRFTVSAADAVAAFRILTPPVLEGIALASGKLNCPLSLAFLNDKIYVAIANGDAFEAVSMGDATLGEQRERVKQEIQAVIAMVETLYLK